MDTTRSVGTWILIWILLLTLIDTAAGSELTITPVGDELSWDHLFDTERLDALQVALDSLRTPAPTPVVRRAAPPPKREVWNGDVEQWRSLVEQYFPAGQVSTAMQVMDCESGGNPNAVSPTNDHGLMQHHLPYWAGRSAAAGYPNGNIYDPATNIAVAGWLQATGGWGHWTCYR